MKEKIDVQLRKPAAEMVVCHCCAYTPPGFKIPEDGRCPKCHGFSWERFEVPIRILAFCFQGY